jgi:hypothetical protein
MQRAKAEVAGTKPAFRLASPVNSLPGTQVLPSRSVGCAGCCQNCGRWPSPLAPWPRESPACFSPRQPCCHYCSLPVNKGVALFAPRLIVKDLLSFSRLALLKAVWKWGLGIGSCRGCLVTWVWREALAFASALGNKEPPAPAWAPHLRNWNSCGSFVKRGEQPCGLPPKGSRPQPASGIMPS